MQSLFAQGLITYPRSNSNALTKDSQSVLLAFANDNDFNTTALREFNTPYNENNGNIRRPHDAITITKEGRLALKKNLKKPDKSRDTLILKYIALSQMKSLVKKSVKTIKITRKIPQKLQWIYDLPFKIEQYDSNILNNFTEINADIVKYKLENALFATMAMNKLGTPATKVDNIKRIIDLGVCSEHYPFNLNEKGYRYFKKLDVNHNNKNVSEVDIAINNDTNANTSDITANTNDDTNPANTTNTKKYVEKIIGKENTEELMEVSM